MNACKQRSLPVLFFFTLLLFFYLISIKMGSIYLFQALLSKVGVYLGGCDLSFFLTLAVLSTSGRGTPLPDDFVSSTLGCLPRYLCALTNFRPCAQSKSTLRRNSTSGLSTWSFFRATSRLPACSHRIGASHT